MSNKKGNASYGPKWQIIESSSDSDDVHSPVPAQISGNEDEDCGDDHQILKGSYFLFFFSLSRSCTCVYVL